MLLLTPAYTLAHAMGSYPSTSALFSFPSPVSHACSEVSDNGLWMA